MKKKLTILVLFCAASSLANSVSVKDFGAKGDGLSLDTKAIQAAIEHVAGLGGGTVCVPAGTYICGSIWLRSVLFRRAERKARFQADGGGGQFSCRKTCRTASR